MPASTVPFDELPPLLRLPADDPAVVRLIACDPGQIERSSYYGFVELKERGLSVMFGEARWVLPAAESTDSSRLYLRALHFHAQGHEGHAQYAGGLPYDVCFGDDEAEVVRKAGPPAETGGGGISVLKRPIPRWLHYTLGPATLRFELGAGGKVELITLFVPQPG
jgi:hypothetical protein